MFESLLLEAGVECVVLVRRFDQGRPKALEALNTVEFLEKGINVIVQLQMPIALYVQNSSQKLLGVPGSDFMTVGLDAFDQIRR